MSDRVVKKLRDGEIILYTRGRSPNIQARLKLPDTNTWYRFSTKTSEVDKAVEVSLERLQEEKIKRKYGIVDVKGDNRFETLANETNRRLNMEMKSGKGKITYKDYIRVIKQYLIPFFGNTPIDKIDYKKLSEFDTWRMDKMGKQPAKSTLSTHNAAFNQVFKTAMKKGVLETWKVPKLFKDGRDGEIRAYFTHDEYKTLYTSMRKWCNTGRSQKTRELRELLRDFVLILANTGLRYGEAYNLRWNNIGEVKSPYKNDDEVYLVLYVDGKTGKRETIARDTVRNYLDRIRERFPELKDLSYKELFKIDEYVFRLADGNRPYQFQHSFDQLLRDTDLTYDKHRKKRSLYSLRHTYVTYQIMYNDQMDLHTLARNIGSSQKIIEKHYSHLQPYMKARELSGKPMIVKPMFLDEE